MRIKACGKTDVGRVRKNNEDSIGMFPENPTGQLPHNNVFIVADGMGGQAAGEVASRLAVEMVVGAYRNAEKVGSSTDQNRAALYLEEALVAANLRILEEVKKDSSLEGMGATAVAAHLENGAIYLAHAGDSRCYRIRDGQLDRLTRDHSIVQELYDAGRIEQDEMITHPKRNVVLRAMGADADLEFELAAFEAEVGDIFLFCTDGLSGAVTDAAIQEVFLRHGASDDLDALCDDLIALANDTDGADNVSVILVKLLDGKGLPGGKAWGAVAGVFLAFAVVLALRGWWQAADSQATGNGRIAAETVGESRNPAVVYMGDFSDRREAILERDTLVRRGFQGFIVMGHLEGNPRYHLFVEGGSDLAAASKVVRFLQQAGYRSRLVPIAFPYALQVGNAFRSRSDAVALRDRLLEAGFFPYLADSATDSGLTSTVLIGLFARPDEANALSQQVADLGWHNQVVYR